MCPLPSELFAINARAKALQFKSYERTRFYQKDGVVYELGTGGKHDAPPKSHLEVLEARYAELEREAAVRAKKERMMDACRTCRFHVDLSPGMGWDGCREPLVKGHGKARDWYSTEVQTYCTDDRVLWQPIEPKPSLWQRFVDWLASL